MLYDWKKIGTGSLALLMVAEMCLAPVALAKEPQNRRILSQTVATISDTTVDSAGWVTASWLEGGRIQFESATGTIVGADSSIIRATIPETIQGVTVVGIEEFAFASCKSLEKVVIPATVRRVGGVQGSGNFIYGAFYGCDRLTSAGPLGSGASIEFGWRDEIPSYSFSQMTTLNAVTIPDTITKIGSSAFSCDDPSESNQITSITIPKSVKEIQSYAFWVCSSLKTVQYQGTEAEWEAISMGTSPFPEGVTLLFQAPEADNSQDTTFTEGDFLCRLLKSSDSSQTDGVEIVQYQGNDTDVIIPTKIQALPVTKIGPQAFYQNSNMTYITIPSTVTEIAAAAVDLCPNFREVNFLGTESQWRTISMGENNQLLENTQLFFIPNGFIFAEDAFPFTNSSDYFAEDLGFASIHYLTQDMERSLKYAFLSLFDRQNGDYAELFAPNGIYDQCVRDQRFNGVCFGMGTLAQSLANYAQIPANYSPNATTAQELTLPSLPEDLQAYSDLKVAMYYYQLLQYVDSFSDLYYSKSLFGTMKQNLQAIVQLLTQENGPQAVSLALFADYNNVGKKGGHSMVAYGIDTRSDPDYYLVKTYDPNDKNDPVILHIARDFSSAEFRDSYWGPFVKIERLNAPITAGILMNYHFTSSSSRGLGTVSTLSTATERDYISLTTEAEYHFIVESGGKTATILHGEVVSGDMGEIEMRQYQDSSLVSYRLPLANDVQITYIDENGTEISDATEFYTSVRFGGSSDTLAMVSTTSSGQYFASSGTVILDNGHQSAETSVTLTSFHGIIPWDTTVLTTKAGDLTLENSKNQVSVSSSEPLRTVELSCTNDLNEITTLDLNLNETSFTIEPTEHSGNIHATIKSPTGGNLGSIALGSGELEEENNTTTPDSSDTEEIFPEKLFDDVKTSDWHYSYVKYALEENLMSGMGGRTFGPNEETLRSMIVTILYSIAGKPSTAPSSLFHDVLQSDYFYLPCIWASQQQIVSGVGNGAFAPNDPVSREQICAMIYKYALTQTDLVTSLPQTTVFSDSGDISSWAKEAIDWCRAQGIVDGYADGTFRPQSSASRAEIATMLTKFHHLVR